MITSLDWYVSFSILVFDKIPKKDCVMWNVAFINLIAVIYRIHILLYTHVRENHMIICLMLCCLKRHLLSSLFYWVGA